MTTDLLKKNLGINVDAAYGLEALQTYGIDIKKRHIWISGTNIQLSSADEAGYEPGVEYMMANRVIKNLHLLLMQSATEPVVIHLHTCGGLWEEGMAIYDAIKSMPYHVTIVNHIHARSMSSIILQAADHRVMMPHSCFMFHRGTMAAAAEATTFYSIADWYRNTDETMVGIYVDKVKKSKKFESWTEKKITDMIRREMDKRGDVFLTAKETVNWGFADTIFTSWDNLLSAAN